MTSDHRAGETTTPAGRPGHPSARVTAVIVAHNGTRWLPQLFRSLEASTRFPDRLVAVDTGSLDETPQLLVDVLGESAVHTLDRSIGFGTAVQQALDLTDGSEPDEDGWLWLL